MSESYRSDSEKRTRLMPPLSRVAIFSSLEEPDRILLRFRDIPYGTPDDHRFLLNGDFFDHFAFQLWNASQPKKDSLMRYLDLEHRGIWLFNDRKTASQPILGHAKELVDTYYVAGSAEDAFTANRISFIESELKKDQDTE